MYQVFVPKMIIIFVIPVRFLTKIVLICSTLLRLTNKLTCQAAGYHQ